MALPKGHKFIMGYVGHQGDDCVIWPYSCCTPGYGSFAHDGKRGILAHRFMCEMTHGPAPSKTHLAAHSCGNRRCVNPKHIRWRTPSENQYERREHGTSNKFRTKLTLTQARQIRRLKGIETAILTAARYGITESNVRQIQEGKTWKESDRKMRLLGTSVRL